MPQPSPLNRCFAELEEAFASPVDGTALRLEGADFVAASGERYPIADNIADFCAGDASAALQIAPGNYADIPDRDHLRRRETRDLFTSMLDRQLPAPSIVLILGCGSGYLTNFLGMAPWRRVMGCDSSADALRVGEEFRAKFEINNAAFVRANASCLPFMPASLDAIVCTDLTSFASKPRESVARMVEKLRPGGLLAVGLRNSYAALPALIGRAVSLRPRRQQGGTYTQGKVLRWFDDEGLEFLSALPSLDGTTVDHDDRLFEPHTRAGPLRRALGQLTMLQQRSAGDVFMMIARKPS